MIMMNVIACGVYDIYNNDEITSGGLPKMAMGRFLLTLPPSGSIAGEQTFIKKKLIFFVSKDWGENLFVEKGTSPNKTIFFLLLKNWMFCFLSRMRAGHV